MLKSGVALTSIVSSSRGWRVPINDSIDAGSSPVTVTCSPSTVLSSGEFVALTCVVSDGN